MRKLNLSLLALTLCSASVVAAAPSAQDICIAAFKNPTVTFQSRLILNEWKGTESHAEEANLLYSPPGMYRIEFLGFDGTVNKVVVSDTSKNQISLQQNNHRAAMIGVPSQFSDLISSDNKDLLLKKNYQFNLKGSEKFIGRDVWVVEMTPKTSGKPKHELKIDKETLVVLEHRRYLPNDKVGSLTRFSTFEPNKEFANDTFVLSGIKSDLATKHDNEVTPLPTTPPPANMATLPEGFSLNSYNVFQVEGTAAQHFFYSDGALPISVFQTQLPIRFPEKATASDKMDFMIVPTYGISSVNQVAYGKRNGKYITVIGEASPTLLQSIARRIN